MIIGICGLIGSGKDTIADILIKHKGFVKLSFSKILKDIVSILFDWDRNLLEGNTTNSRKWRNTIDIFWTQKFGFDITPRFVLQFIGTDLFRNHFHQDFWILLLEKQLLKYDNIVISDCRFPNEIQLLRKYNSIIINVRRNTPPWFFDYINYKIDKPINIHESEYIWIREKFDYIINNDYDINTLQNNILNLLK